VFSGHDAVVIVWQRHCRKGKKIKEQTDGFEEWVATTGHSRSGREGPAHIGREPARHGIQQHEAGDREKEKDGNSREGFSYCRRAQHQLDRMASPGMWASNERGT